MATILKIEDILKNANQHLNNNVRQFSWHGKQVKYKYSLSRSEQTELEQIIVECCVNHEAEQVVPSLYDISFKINVLGSYIYMEKPAEIDDVFNLIYNTDLYEVVSKLINQEQLNAIRRTTALMLGLGWVGL